MTGGDLRGPAAYPGRMTQPHDLVLFGATGFVGRLIAQHLAAAAPEGLRVALAGRSRQRLEQVREQDGRPEWELVEADSDDPASLAAMASGTRVVASTVGPYARHGLPLVQACAEAGTDYVDLTGEVLFVRDAVDQAHQTAARTGARIVPSCGFDSVPSDLAVHLLHRAAQEAGHGPLTDTTLLVTRLKGGLSGGTVDSMRLQLQTVRGDAQAARLARDPYALAPDPITEPRVAGQRDSSAVFVDEASGLWTAPFVMASYNTRLVRRSHALTRELGHADGYGSRFRYRELMATGRGTRGRVRAEALRAGLGALAVGMSTPGLSAVLDRLLPAPGDGPSAQERAAGHFQTRTSTLTQDGHRYTATVAADGDPGYAATCVMLGESALALALDGDRCHRDGGVLTPAVALGDVLVQRLRDQGFTLSVRPGEPA